MAQEVSGDLRPAHRADAVAKLGLHFQMPRVDASPLAQKVVDRLRTLIVDDGLRYIPYPIPLTADKRLNAGFVHSRVRRNAVEDLAKGDHLACLEALEVDLVVLVPAG